MINALFSSTMHTLVKKLQIITLYTIGRLLPSQRDLPYHYAFFFNLCKPSFSLISTSIALFLPSYQHASDITLFMTDSSNHYTLFSSAESITGHVSVIHDNSSNRSGGITVMKCDHSLIGGIYAAHQNVSIFQVFYMMDFVQYIKVERNNNRNKKAMVIGLGAGITAKEMMRDGVDVDLVEIDGKVYEYAKKYFGVDGKHNAFVMDAVKYVREEARIYSYDYIIHDVFSGGNVHPSLFSLAFIQELKSKLNVGGVLALVCYKQCIRINNLEFFWFCKG